MDQVKGVMRDGIPGMSSIRNVERNCQVGDGRGLPKEQLEKLKSHRWVLDTPTAKAHSFRGGMKVRLEQAWLYATSNVPTIFVYLLLFVGTTDTMWV